MIIKEDISLNQLRKRRLIVVWLSGSTFSGLKLNCLYRHHIRLLPEIIKFRTMRRYGCEISPYATIGE